MALYTLNLSILLNLLLYIVSSTYDYGLVIDAGSTHSQLFIYQFNDRITSNSTPPQSSPQQIASSSSDPRPIAKLQSQFECNSLISTLTSYAKSQLQHDKHRWDEFPIYLKATAGMRVLPNSQREAILGWIENAFFNLTINPFFFDATQGIIASGEEEATFDWLAVNYIFDTLINNNYDINTMGALDLGGQSTQIAFAADPSGNILADFTAVRLWQKTHRLYTHSFLMYGVDAIEQRVAQKVYDLYGGVHSINGMTYNPCLNNGTNTSYIVQFNNGSNGTNVQYGISSGDPYKCRNIMQSFLYNKTKCLTGSCSINGVYQPELPQNMTFVAFSGFWYAINNLNLPNNISLYDFYYNVTINACNLTYSELKLLYPNVKNKYLNVTCRLNTYIFTLLSEAYGFDINNSNILWVSKYNGSDITWTQGSILRDSNWLPYDVKYHVKDNDNLTEKGKMYRALFITLASILFVVIIGLFYLIYRAKKKSVDGYSSMGVDNSINN